MTTSSYVKASYDSHQRIYNQRNYVQTTYSSNQCSYPSLTTLPIPSIDFCERLLYEDYRSTPSASSFINSTLEHYDNTIMHTYDNPLEYHEKFSMKQSLVNIPDVNENLYDNKKSEEMNIKENSINKSTILCYGEKTKLIFYICFTSLALLLVIAVGILLLNKFIRPVVIHTTVNNHYDRINVTNVTMTHLTTPIEVTTTIAVGNLPFPYATCPPDRWGTGCQNICKPCGLGVCHSITGKCICPVDIYGEFCDLWKVNDKPKRGDMTD